VTCWWCGVEPDEVIEIRNFGGTVSLIPHWPAGDHTHAEKPPTADEMLDAILLRREP
jgi:hypothetical protein